MTLGKLDTPDVAENAEETAALEAATTDIYAISDWVARYRKLKQMEAEIAARVKEANEMIKGYLHDRNAEFGAIDGQLVVRRREVVSNRIDTKALKEKEPEIAERFTKPSTSVRLELIDS
jgi:predicted phage-related endonuclease